jgi:hypothetical protein
MMMLIGIRILHKILKMFILYVVVVVVVVGSSAKYILSCCKICL